MNTRVMHVHEYPVGDFPERVRAAAMAAKVAIDGGGVEALPDEVLLRAALALDVLVRLGTHAEGISTCVAVAVIAENFAAQADEGRAESVAALLAERLPEVPR